MNKLISEEQRDENYYFLKKGFILVDHSAYRG